MSDEETKPAADTLTEHERSVLRGKTRDLEMFKLWMQGTSCATLAHTFNLSVNSVYKIRKRDRWEKLRQEFNERVYMRQALRLKALTVRLVDAVEKDFNIIIKKLSGETPVALTPEERTHIRMTLDRLLKENRLSDGKPTDIGETTGVVEHRIKLPPGVKRFGVIPPGDNVKQIESTEEQQTKDAAKVTIDDLDGIE